MLLFVAHFGMPCALAGMVQGQTLGRQRSDFGDKYEADNTTGDNFLWIYHNMWAEFYTRTYFPIGKSNERYYVNGLGDINPKTH
jgi:hypothetical protein